ncbi:MAG: hypothetical protein ACR2QB_07650 [Gammaproteobacteria bacterium]
MARRSPQTQAKRQREFAKLEKRQDKAEKKALRKSMKEAAANGLLPTEEPSTAEPTAPDETDPQAT